MAPRPLARRRSRARLGRSAPLAAALALALAAPAAHAVSLTSVTTALGGANSTNLLSETASLARVRASSVGVVSNAANSFQTRYAMLVGTDAAQIAPSAAFTESFTASYTITLSILGDVGEPWFLLIDTSRVGSLTILHDGNGSASATLGAVTGGATGGILTGDLGLAAAGSASNASAVTTNVDAPFSQLSSARIDGVGTGAIQNVVLSFSWTASTTSTRTGNNGDEAAVRMGQASTVGFAADDYPGALFPRTQALDGHFVTATLIPEPHTALLLGAGLSGLAWSSRRRGRTGRARRAARAVRAALLLAAAGLASWAPPASALTVSAPSIANASTTPGSGGNAADRAAQQGSQVLASNALGFTTRFWTTGAADRGFSLAGGTANQGTTMSYTISFTVVRDAGEAYSITVTTALLGALTVLDDASGLAGAGSASAGVVSGSMTGGSVATGGLGLSPASGPIGGTSSTSGAVTVVSRSNVATIDAIGTGLPQAYTLTFGASFAAGSPQGFFGGDEASYRFGLAAATGSVLAGASADDYAGPGARNGVADGHFVTVAVIPEPETALLLGAGLLGLAGFGRRHA